jgi:hypothetical protein
VNAYQTVQSEMRLAQEHLRKAMGAAMGIDRNMKHELAQLVFATGAQLEAWQNRHANELDDG